MVISELPVGSVVRLGRYTLGHRPDELIDIDWIKVSKSNEFIAQKVLLGMPFDAREGWNANYSYRLSNIRQFMNSEQQNWYNPTHPNDSAPGYVTFDSYMVSNLNRYCGLLYHFSDEEINLLNPMDGDRIRLPKLSEIMAQFPYFKRYGKRAHAVRTYGELDRNDYREGTYHRYYILGDGENELLEMGRDGYYRAISPIRYSGVRPVCKIDANAEVIETGNNTYKMNLSSSEPVRFFKETQSIDWLLGV